jgi:hypothetical protein
VPLVPVRRTVTLPNPSSVGMRPDPTHWFGVSCASCGSSRITRISMVLTDGSPVDFTSCHDCEHKTWTDSGVDLALAGVLDKTRRR